MLLQKFAVTISSTCGYLVDAVHVFASSQSLPAYPPVPEMVIHVWLAFVATWNIRNGLSKS